MLLLFPIISFSSEKAKNGFPINVAVSAGGNNGNERGIKVSKCIEDKLKKITFPRPVGGGIVGVSQPINFYQKQ